MALTPEWIRAGLIVAGIIVAVVVAVHVLGASGAPTAPTGTAATSTPQSSTNGSNPQGSGPFISSNSGQPLPPVQETAQALGISPATLLADIQSGETVAQLAQAQHVPLTTVNAAYLHGVQELNASFVQSGAASQATADQIYQQEVQQVQHGQYDLLRGSNGPVSVGG